VTARAADLGTTNPRPPELRGPHVYRVGRISPVPATPLIAFGCRPGGEAE
jgi:hypothetical protein